MQSQTAFYLICCTADQQKDCFCIFILLKFHSLNSAYMKRNTRTGALHFQITIVSQQFPQQNMKVLINGTGPLTYTDVDTVRDSPREGTVLTIAATNNSKQRWTRELMFFFATRIHLTHFENYLWFEPFHSQKGRKSKFGKMSNFHFVKC